MTQHFNSLQNYFFLTPLAPSFPRRTDENPSLALTNLLQASRKHDNSTRKNMHVNLPELIGYSGVIPNMSGITLHLGLSIFGFEQFL